ncbi:MAG: hypothetical protein H6702_14815 [Myxococcales bacterium]|nr:hypothetical protein [Myxococcales bacterium]
MRILILLCLLALASSAQALMPPHADQVSPGDGAVLTGRTLSLSGYTLGSLDDVVKITDDQGEAVPFLARTDCQWVGKGTAPGARQQRCHGIITLTGALKPGQTIQLTLFRDTYRYTVSADGVPDFDPTAPTPRPGPPRPIFAPRPPSAPASAAPSIAPEGP